MKQGPRSSLPFAGWHLTSVPPAVVYIDRGERLFGDTDDLRKKIGRGTSKDECDVDFGSMSLDGKYFYLRKKWFDI